MVDKEKWLDWIYVFFVGALILDGVLMIGVMLAGKSLIPGY